MSSSYHHQHQFSQSDLNSFEFVCDEDEVEDDDNNNVGFVNVSNRKPRKVYSSHKKRMLKTKKPVKQISLLEKEIEVVDLISDNEEIADNDEPKITYEKITPKPPAPVASFVIFPIHPYLENIDDPDDIGSATTEESDCEAESTLSETVDNGSDDKLKTEVCKPRAELDTGSIFEKDIGTNDELAPESPDLRGFNNKSAIEEFSVNNGIPDELQTEFREASVGAKPCIENLITNNEPDDKLEATLALNTELFEEPVDRSKVVGELETHLHETSFPSNIISALKESDDEGYEGSDELKTILSETGVEPNVIEEPDEDSEGSEKSESKTQLCETTIPSNIESEPLEESFEDNEDSEFKQVGVVVVHEVEDEDFDEEEDQVTTESESEIEDKNESDELDTDEGEEESQDSTGSDEDSEVESDCSTKERDTSTGSDTDNSVKSNFSAWRTSYDYTSEEAEDPEEIKYKNVENVVENMLLCDLESAVTYPNSILGPEVEVPSLAKPRYRRRRKRRKAVANSSSSDSDMEGVPEDTCRYRRRRRKMFKATNIKAHESPIEDKINFKPELPVLRQLYIPLRRIDTPPRNGCNRFRVIQNLPFMEKEPTFTRYGRVVKPIVSSHISDSNSDDSEEEKKRLKSNFDPNFRASLKFLHSY